MAPTRELAVQIEEEAKMLGKYLPFKIGSFYGGVGYTQQQQLLRDNVQILVGTPGRVLDLNKSGRMNLMDIAFLVLDEADRMFDMGFYPDLRKLIKVVPPADRRQTMLFSATLNAWVKNLAWEYTKSPREIDIAPEIVTVEEIEQVLYHVPSEEKMKLLLGILEREQPESAIIFCNTKRYTEIVAKRLRINGYDCEFIIGDLPQSRRLKVIEDGKAGRIKFLVATDVAARGLDIESLAMVVNYDLPVEAENYVHRIGRTARAGKTGKAITLASEQDVYELPAIERYIGKKIPSEIAMAELHAGDKSAGMHIRTEFYEDRREERHLHGGAKSGVPRGGRGARPHGGRGSDSRGSDGHGGRRREEHHGDRSRGPGHVGQSHAGQGHTGEGRAGGNTRRHKGGGYAGENAQGAEELRKSGVAAAEQDISRLSFEERMALYKKKYDSGQQGGGRKHKRHNSRQGNTAQTAADGRDSRRSGSGGKKAEAEIPRKQQNNPTTRPAAEQPQKGILSRIFGIFKKK
jgi:ATP-dependent RNA helicase RhlB